MSLTRAGENLMCRTIDALEASPSYGRATAAALASDPAARASDATLRIAVRRIADDARARGDAGTAGTLEEVLAMHPIEAQQFHGRAIVAVGLAGVLVGILGMLGGARS